MNILFDGETKTVEEWAAEYGLSPRTLRRRLQRGWTPFEAITTPVDSPDMGARRRDGWDGDDWDWDDDWDLYVEMYDEDADAWE